VIRWDAPGPYEVVFPTRAGGVSEGPFASLNLALMSGDDVERVRENRRLLCETVGADVERLSTNRQRHTVLVHRAEPGRYEPGDGLWTDEPGLPMLKLTADCVPIAIVRANGDRPAACALHAGWRGLSEGIVAEGVRALGGGTLAACVGPAIGPCCYEVGTEVAALFDADLVAGRKLDLWGAAERALRAAGVDTVERTDLCTRCHPELFFSHRRDGRARGVQGVVGAVA